MQAGTLKQSVKFQAQSATKDETGHKIDSWSDIASSTRPASIEPVSGRDYFAALGQNYSVTTKITVRYDSLTAARTPGNRIVDTRTSEVYEINSVINTASDRRHIVFMCEIKNRD
jgi:SPP1 family predicted phage head-tail adaptor